MFQVPFGLKLLLFHMWSLLYLCSAFWKGCLLFLDCLFVSLLHSSSALLHIFPSSSRLCLSNLPLTFLPIILSCKPVFSNCRPIHLQTFLLLFFKPLALYPLPFLPPKISLSSPLSLFSSSYSQYSPNSSIYLPFPVNLSIYLNSLFIYFLSPPPCVSGYSWWE